MMKIQRNGMTVASAGNTMIGKSKGPVKSIKVQYDTAIEKVLEEARPMQAVEQTVVDITPVSKPSDRFNVEDYILYREYVISHGGVPSVEDYFVAINYYKKRA